MHDLTTIEEVLQEVEVAQRSSPLSALRSARLKESARP
jgi:hypothetical protein